MNNINGIKQAILFEGKVTGGSQSIFFDGSAFPKGVYLLKTSSYRQLGILKILKQ